jgi:hypothetical protein
MVKCGTAFHRSGLFVMADFADQSRNISNVELLFIGKVQTLIGATQFEPDFYATPHSR